ncbi:MAG: hypothetical protein B6D77_09035 [gamma proteobacterium symbiont of Ctena orbiculata]|nr:MAG: hypothetical protein B6D77_09035 [gamma proteobacterium symbiont of Ctena orbiculata]PVV20365.1 MAG: hypothetical protein B6D78_10570 [gamma proteobacterium symbiont of Ctena orbiculata]PVV27517.1 MAG: hypothetical protein B6D79_02005 [gamma proteobacterium symbiont of Ctena orbiculata]
MGQTLEQDLKTLATARVFFGHQSVGKNIIAGMEDLIGDYPGVDLKITADSAEIGEASGCLLHTAVGKNTEPLSKCVDFARLIDQELAGKIDYALLKFCYIDVDRDSDVQQLFTDYKGIMDELINRHPEITFIHTTMPLRHTPGGLSVWIRELLGRPNNSKLDNIKRNQFNQLLRSSFSHSPIIDIATSESTYADGKRESFKTDGQTYYSLIGEYTNDGGHLNENGRARVAAAFVRELAQSIRNHP